MVALTDIGRAMIVGVLPFSALALFAYCAGVWRFTRAGRKEQSAEQEHEG